MNKDLARAITEPEKASLEARLEELRLEARFAERRLIELRVEIRQAERRLEELCRKEIE